MPELLLLEVSKTRRLRILTPTEIDDLFARPQLTDDERTWLFELNQEEQTILVSNMSIAAKVDAIIRLGYFKNKQQFFSFNLHEIPDDVKHVIERYFLPATLDKPAIGRVAKLSNQQWILRITGYTLFSQSQHVSILSEKAKKIMPAICQPSIYLSGIISGNNPEKDYATRLQYIPDVCCPCLKFQKMASSIMQAWWSITLCNHLVASIQIKHASVNLFYSSPVAPHA